MWVPVEHSLLCRQIHKQISCNSSRLHAGCVWSDGDELNGALKKLISNICSMIYWVKYLVNICKFQIQFSQCCWPRIKKIIWRCFFQLELICLCAKFYAYPAPATCFLPINVTFLTNMWWQYFSFNFCRVFHHSKVEFSDLDHNWARNTPLLFKTF